MLDDKTVAKILGTTAAKVREAARKLGNIGTTGRNQAIYFKSDDIDQIKEYLGL
jgi:hypothetical protein